MPRMSDAKNRGWRGAGRLEEAESDELAPPFAMWHKAGCVDGEATDCTRSDWPKPAESRKKCSAVIQSVARDTMETLRVNRSPVPVYH